MRPLTAERCHLSLFYVADGTFLQSTVGWEASKSDLNFQLVEYDTIHFVTNS